MAYLRNPTNEELARIKIPPCEKADPHGRSFYNHWEEQNGIVFLGINLSSKDGPYEEVLLPGRQKVLGWNRDQDELSKLINEHPWQSDQIYGAAVYLENRTNPKNYLDYLAEFGIF